jgi:hypothetical protein
LCRLSDGFEREDPRVGKRLGENATFYSVKGPDIEDDLRIHPTSQLGKCLNIGQDSIDVRGTLNVMRKLAAFQKILRVSIEAVPGSVIAPCPCDRPAKNTC